jgi:hypothetical protein
MDTLDGLERSSSRFSTVKILRHLRSIQRTLVICDASLLLELLNS